MQGQMYLGVIPTIAPFILNELHTSCEQLYPNLTLFIREDTTDQILAQLAQGKLDLALLALPYPIEGLQTRVLSKDHFNLVLPKSWLNKNIDKDLAHLPDNSIFLLEKEHCLTGHALQACQLKDSKKLNPFYASSLHTLIHMVSHYPGITFLPDLVLRDGLLLGANLSSISLNSEFAYREIAVAWRPSSYQKQNVTLLSDLIQTLLEGKGSREHSSS